MSKSIEIKKVVSAAGKAAAIAGTCLATGPNAAKATEFTAGIVMERMSEAERPVFVAGIIEGLAMARYARDRQQSQGMQCIYNWYYQSPETLQTIYAGFRRYPTYPPGTVVHVLASQRCGE